MIEIKKTENSEFSFDIIVADSYEYKPKITDLCNKFMGVFGKVNIYTESDIHTSSKRKIYVGNTSFYSTKFPPAQTILSEDGIIIHYINKDFIVNGFDSRSVVYALYRFIQKNMGIKIWSETEIDYFGNDYILAHSERYSPLFKLRSIFSFSARYDEEFSLLNALNGNSELNTQGIGKTIKVLNWAHSFYKVFPYTKYAPAHPDWFLNPTTGQPLTTYDPTINGISTQPNFNNPDCREQLIQDYVKLFADNPDYDYIDVSQNDNTIFTQPVSGENYADVLCSVLIEIGNRAKLQNVSKKIVTLAYHTTREAPLRNKNPKGNSICVRYAPLVSNMAYPLSHPSNYTYNNLALGWAKDTNYNVWYWGYTTNFRYPQLPYPAFSNRVDIDLKDLQTMGFTGAFIQDAEGSMTGYFQHMKAWVLPKMLWNPFQNMEDLVVEFFKGYYGDSWSYLYDYYNLVRECFVFYGNGILSAYQEDYSFLNTPYFRNKSLELINSAKEISNGTKYQARVELIETEYNNTLTYLNK